MSTNAPTRRRTALARHLPTPVFEAWGVWLAYDDARSDKEYRIIVDGETVLYQWGRRTAGGQFKRERHSSHDAAMAAAREQWAAKEAKGYWPVSGVVPLIPDAFRQVHSGEQIVAALSHTILQSAGDVARDRSALDATDRLCLMQLPPFSEVSNLVLHAADVLAGRMGASGPVTAGSFQLLAVPKAAVDALTACCPVLLDVGAWEDTNAALLAQTALQLAHDLHSVESSREAFALAVELVDSLR